MVATAATSAFFSVTPLPPKSGATARASAKVGAGGSTSSDACGIRSKASGSSKGLDVKVSAQAPCKIKGTPVSWSEGARNREETWSPSPRTFINQLPDWSVLLAAITTAFLSAEKQWAMIDWKPRRHDVLVDQFGLGQIVQDGVETALNHVKSVGLMGDGFGSTPEMCKRDLIWVIARMQVLVDRYPVWGDVVQVDTWVCPSGKNGMRRDWLLRDSNTGEIMARASSVCVMMNKKTRRLSKMPVEVRTEIQGYFVDKPPVIAEDERKLTKLDVNTAEHIRKGLTARWSDLDVNRHVNNVKYIGWILESAPSAIMETHELAGMTMEYRRECGRDDVLQSLTTITGASVGGLLDSGNVQCQHLLRLEDGSEVVRARTQWRPKHFKSFGKFDSVQN
ncbi:Palmitoyl-acyl carrier protein thioesterase, chloroplastic-like protein [Drosera capensis]